MKNKIIIIVFLNFFFFANSQNKKNSYFNDQKINLFVFVAEKISIQEFDPNKNNTVKEYDSIEKDTISRKRYVMDRAFRVKYKILKNVFNDLKTVEIEFIVYDHYGKPNFEKSKNVMLYISKSSNNQNYFHQKYQYDEVNKDKNGNWFGYIQNKNSKKKKRLV